LDESPLFQGGTTGGSPLQERLPIILYDFFFASLAAANGT
jgi:hypothetical protein